MSERQQLLLKRGMGVFAATLVALLAVGTFADNQIAQTIYAPHNPLVIFISTLGLFPLVYPDDEQAEAIYLSMHKEDKHSREINCSACGYETCREMMLAVHNGFNTRHNCVYSEKEESIYLTKMSFSDQLTGVMNRNAYQRKLNSLYGHGSSLGLIIADVNGLKYANDNEGHAAGDRLIIETAHALANEFGVERVFRTGGDEFLVVLQDFKEQELESDIRLVKEYLSSVKVSTSIGLAYSEHFSGDINELQETADMRMYEDKERYYQMTGKTRRS